MKPPKNFHFIGDPAKDRVKTPLYWRERDDGMMKFAGYWWHDEPIEHAARRGFATWIDPGTQVSRA